MKTRDGIILAMLASSLFMSCGSSSLFTTSCKDRTVSRQQAGDMEVVIKHRECGSLAGYMLSIAPPGLDTYGRARKFEPFQVLCSCFGSVDQHVPFDVRIGPDDTIVVRYDPSVRVIEQRLIQGRFRLEYVADPALTSGRQHEQFDPANVTAATIKAETNARAAELRKKGGPLVVGVVFRQIPAGTLQMGCTSSDSDCNRDERPAHGVTISRSFSMAETDTTNAQYRMCVEAGKCAAPGDAATFNDEAKGEHPVTNVNWEDAYTFCLWLEARLPREAEWEYAARGGLNDWRYPWGNAISHENANYRGTGGQDQWDTTSPVGSFPANRYGLYDMAGNVWQWCADWYDKAYYKSSPASDPGGPSLGNTLRVLRGGSWFDSPAELRVSYRGRLHPSIRGGNSGFRCARDVIP